MKTDRISLEALREIGWTQWDPIGLIGSRGCAPDEYDSYLLQAVSRIRNGANDAEVAAYLGHIQSEEMGMGPADLGRGQATSAALRAYLATLDPGPLKVRK